MMSGPGGRMPLGPMGPAIHNSGGPPMAVGDGVAQPYNTQMPGGPSVPPPTMGGTSMGQDAPASTGVPMQSAGSNMPMQMPGVGGYPMGNQPTGMMGGTVNQGPSMGPAGSTTGQMSANMPGVPNAAGLPPTSAVPNMPPQMMATSGGPVSASGPGAGGQMIGSPGPMPPQFPPGSHGQPPPQIPPASTSGQMPPGQNSGYPGMGSPMPSTNQPMGGPPAGMMSGPNAGPMQPNSQMGPGMQGMPGQSGPGMGPGGSHMMGPGGARPPYNMPPGGQMMNPQQQQQQGGFQQQQRMMNPQSMGPMPGINPS